MNDSFWTIRRPSRTETRVRGSRFIATAAPAPAAAEAVAFLDHIRAEFHDATHNCYAYRIGPDGNETRFNDDGEPSGTAGRPILAAVERSGLTNTIVVVSRYFGGTKLGVGGLGRAYGAAADAVLSNAHRVQEIIVERMRIVFPHPLTGAVMHCLSRAGARIAETTYDNEVHLRLEVRTSAAASLRALLLENTGGNVRFPDSD